MAAAVATTAEEDLPEQPLAEHLMGFSNIGRTVDGNGFVYRSVACVGKRIGVIKAVEAYSHLQHVDLSQNAIKDVGPLKGLKYVLRLNLSQNAISSLQPWSSEEEVFQHLLHLDLSGNSIPTLPPLPMKALRSVSFAQNEISSCQEFTGHGTIEALDLSENRITSLAGVTAMPALTRLDVSSNELEDINGLSELPLLEDLNLARNKFQALEGPWQELSALSSVDLSGCQLATTKPLEALRQLPKLRSLATKENPFADAAEAGGRVEVLVCHWRLTSIDGEPVGEEELEQARELNVRRLEEERERIKAEEEAAAAAAGDDE